MIGRLGTLILVAFAVSSPWWCFNLLRFGDIVPISGHALQISSTGPFTTTFATMQAISNALLVVFHVPAPYAANLKGSCGFALWGILALSWLVFGGRLAVARAWRSQWQVSWCLWRLRCLAGLFVLLAAYYTWHFNAPHFQARYLVTVRLLVLLVVLVGLVAWIEVLTFQWKQRAVVALVGGYVLLGGLLFSRNWGDEVGNIFLVPQAWISSHATAPVRVGMFQSGTTGFFCQNVVNLDGKVNVAANHALRSGRLPEYVEAESLDYIIDWDVYTRHVFSNAALRRQYSAIDTLPEGFVVWRREVQ